MHAAFLADILAHPDDDTPRLIYADWLDGHGEPERAEFIRVQCAIARICDGNRKGRPEGDACRLDELIGREAALMTSVWSGDWLAPAEKAWLSDSVIRRGFIESLSLPAEDWVRHGDALVQAAPIREVRLTTWPTRDDRRQLLARWKRLNGMDWPDPFPQGATLRAFLFYIWRPITFHLPDV